jgi:Gpi18-like mannosyltransferase
VSSVFQFLALYYFARLVMDERDLDAARFCTWALALSPMAFFLTALYTESPFLAGAAAALYFARRGNTVAAGAAACFACAMRVTGVALMPPLALQHVLQRRGRVGFSALAILLIPAPLALFALYMQVHVGDALAYVHAHQLPSFSDAGDWPWRGLAATWRTVFSLSPANLTWVFGLELIWGIAGFVICVVAWAYRRFPAYLAIFVSSVWVVSTSLAFWRSVPRYELAMFPALIMLADATRHRPGWRSAIITVSSGFMAVGAAIYARGWWLG